MDSDPWVPATPSGEDYRVRRSQTIPPPRSLPTILVVGVAGMLVFAAVLFESPKSSPPPTCGLECGFLFSWGTPVNDSGSSSSGCGGTVARYCYSIEIAGAGGSLRIYNMNLSLQLLSGAALPWPSPPHSDIVWLLSPRNGSPVAAFNTTSFGWIVVGNYTGIVAAGYSIVIITGGVGSPYGLRGDDLVFHGINGVTATVPSNAFP